MDLDAIDLELLAILRNNCRTPLRDLGSQVGLTAPAVNARLKRMESIGIISAYTITISPDISALNLEALILVKVNYGRFDEFIFSMEKSLCVISCERLTGDYTHLVRAAFADVQKLHAFIEEITRNYGPCQSSLVLKKEFPQREALALKAQILKKI